MFLFSRIEIKTKKKLIIFLYFFVKSLFNNIAIYIFISILHKHNIYNKCNICAVFRLLCLIKNIIYNINYLRIACMHANNIKIKNAIYSFKIISSINNILVYVLLYIVLIFYVFLMIDNSLLNFI